MDPKWVHMKICGEAREQLKVRIICTKISKGSSHKHSMGVKPKYIAVTWIQIPSFDEVNWKTVLKIPPNGPASDPFGSPASLLWGYAKIKPSYREEPIVVYHGDSNAYLCEQREGQDPLQHRSHLQPLRQRDVERRKLNLQGPAREKTAPTASFWNLVAPRRPRGAHGRIPALCWTTPSQPQMEHF